MKMLTDVLDELRAENAALRKVLEKDTWTMPLANTVGFIERTAIVDALHFANGELPTMMWDEARREAAGRVLMALGAGRMT